MASFNNISGNTTLSVETLSESLRVAHSICSLSIASTGTVGNIITIYKMICRTHPQQTCYVYLLNLSVSNLISSLVFLPLIAINSFFTVWIYGSTFCVLFAYLMYTNLCAEVNALILLTLNRFLKIVHPMTYPTIYESHRNNAIILICSWTLYSLLLLLPVTETWGQMGYDPDKNYCALNRKDNFVFFICGLLVVTSAPVMFFCYMSILNTYVKSKRKIADIKKKTKTKSNLPSEQVVCYTPKDMLLLRTILTVLVCFVLSYLPYLVLVLADPNMALGRWIHTACIYLSWLHVALNPVIYTLRYSKKKK